MGTYTTTEASVFSRLIDMDYGGGGLSIDRPYN